MMDYKVKKETKPKKDWTIYIAILLFATILFGVVYSYKVAIDWGNTHEVIVQSPMLVDTQPIIVISDIEPEIIRLVVQDNEFVDLSTIEEKILDTWGTKDFTVMRAIAKCESNVNVEAVNWASRDIGLYQINWPIWNERILETFGYTLVDMFDVDRNIEVAKWIFDDGGISPWTVINTQCFRNAL